MSTLLLRLAAPLQAWGADSKFDTRQTRREPSRSGVIGLLACALGIRRDDHAALQELSGLSFGVRVEQEGQLLRDYQTVKSYKNRADFVQGLKPDDAYQTYRYYLMDAVFLAAVSSEDEELMCRLEHALRRPAFPLYLGRRSCPPTLPFLLGMRDMPLEDALQVEDWHASETYQASWWRSHPGQLPHLRVVLDAQAGDASVAHVQDVPVAFDPVWRRYAFRNVRETHVKPPAQQEKAVFQQVDTAHDAFAEVEGCT